MKGPRDQGETGSSSALGPSVPGPLVPTFLSDTPEPVLGLPTGRATAMLPVDLLQGGETIILLLKPSAWYIVLGCLGTLGLLGMVALVSSWLEQRYEMGWFDGRALTGLCTLLAIVRLGWQFMEWMSRTYLLTDRRVIRIMGVLRVQMYQAMLRDLNDPRILFSARERVLGLGTLSFSTRGTNIPEAYWVMVNKPEAVREKINHAIQRYGR